MRFLIALVGLAAGFGAHAALAADGDQLQRGHVQFDHWCAPCHAGGLFEGHELAGTVSLRLKYRGAKPPALEDRTDLTAELVAFYIRHGVGGMPFFRKTEISDDEAAAIGAYLARNKK